MSDGIFDLKQLEKIINDKAGNEKNENEKGYCFYDVGKGDATILLNVDIKKLFVSIENDKVKITIQYFNNAEDRLNYTFKEFLNSKYFEILEASLRK